MNSGMVVNRGEGIGEGEEGKGGQTHGDRRLGFGW